MVEITGSKMKPLNIAIDFDLTLTVDPELWAAFICDGKARGHRFYCVTARRNTEENVGLINEWLDKCGCQMPVIFTNLASKVYVVENRGIKIDIWIDDDPRSLVCGH